MRFPGKMGVHVKSYFKPVTFDPLEFRNTMQMGLTGLMIGEVVVYILLKQSVLVGELPSYITDALIIGISALEFLLGPLIGWLGTQRRRSVMVGWVAIALVCMLPAFGLPKPEVKVDKGLCDAWSPVPVGISTMTALRLSILILFGVFCALGRFAITAHGLAYLDEYNPSENLHMNVAVLALIRVLVLMVGTSLLPSTVIERPWLQFLIVALHFIGIIVKLHKFPLVPATMDIQYGGDRGFLRSVSRVLRNKMFVVQVLAMSLLAAALWGFGTQEVEFAKSKYHVVPDTKLVWQMGAVLRAFFLVLGVLLTGYMNTGPVMPTLDKKAAIRNTSFMTIFCVIHFAVMTAVLNCSKGEVAGLGEMQAQPNCGLECGCDRPWIEFEPVCVTEHMTTFYSPCHAGCATASTIGNYAVYTNCTCSPNGHVTAGACGDNSCFAAYSLHTLVFTATILAGTLAFVWQITIMLEAVDRRDKSVALGIASGTVSLFAFVGAHILYLGIKAFSCAQSRGQHCLFQNSDFVPRVGYTSAGLAGGSLIITTIAYIIQHRLSHIEKKQQSEDPSYCVTRI